MLNFAISHDDFYANYFEKKPAFFSGVLHESPMRWHDIDAILNTQEPDERRLQMFFNGQVPPAHFLDEIFEFGRHKKRINKDRFYTLLQQGATLVINQIEDISIPAKQLCAEIGKFTRHTSTCNAYMSAGSASTFGKHWDTHDVFAIQLIGEKRWQIHAPTLPLPLSHQTSGKFGLAPSGPPDLDVVLHEGDVLYIPRGWWHEVTPVTTHSLHLSVGTYAPTMLDYLMWVCRTQLPQLIDARKTCPTDVNDPALVKVLRQLMQEALTQGTLDSFIQTQCFHEKLNGEFHTDLALNITNFSNDLELSLNSVYAITSNINEFFVNDTELNLNTSGRALVELLQRKGTVSWTEARTQLSQFSEESLEKTALELNRYELINLHTPRHL